MPEGPELFLSSRFINNVCRGRVFGKIAKSDISKNPAVSPPADRYIISSSSRGKEIKLTLTANSKVEEKSGKKPNESPHKSLDILFTFGLAGKFDFYGAPELQKHAHLNFFTCDSGPDMVLSFVDYMRFGRWTPGADFSYKDRGPCVLFDHKNFRDNVLKSLNSTVFNKPICEVLLDQRYFNGIGNYLRAEVLYRAKVPPFVSARSVLEPLTDNVETSSKVKSENPDILQLCNLLPHEVINLETSWYDGKDRSDTTNAFNSWLQCYYQEGMKNIADHNKRTIWYSGPLGPLVPKDIQVRGKKRSKSKKKTSENSEKAEKVKKKTASKRRKQDDDANDDVSDAKTARRSRSAKSNDAKDSKGEVEDTSHSVDGNTDKNKPKRKKISKLNGDISAEGKLPQDLKDKLQTGRLTRGKIRQIVDAIEDISEKKTKKSKGKVIKKEKMKDSIIDEVEEANGEIETSAAIKVSARTKTRARSERGTNNGASDVQNKVTQRMKLKTPRKRSMRRLSSSQ